MGFTISASRSWAIIVICGIIGSGGTLTAQSFPIPQRNFDYGDRWCRPEIKIERTLVSFNRPRGMKVHLAAVHPADLYKDTPSSVVETHFVRREPRYPYVRSGGSLTLPYSLADEIQSDRILQPLGLDPGAAYELMVPDPRYCDVYGSRKHCRPIETPGEFSFIQGERYELILADAEASANCEVHVTLEAARLEPWIKDCFGSAAIPLDFADQDFKCVSEGKTVVKVIYRPYAVFHNGIRYGGDDVRVVESTTLSPGVDAVAEAGRLGTVLVVVRMGIGQVFSTAIWPSTFGGRD